MNDLARQDVTPQWKPERTVKLGASQRTRLLRRSPDQTECACGCGKPLTSATGRFNTGHRLDRRTRNVTCACGCGGSMLALPRGSKYLPGHYVRSRKGTALECAVCGKSFYARPSELGRNRKLCSRACWLKQPPGRTPAGVEKMRVTMRERVGEKNPNFRHGKRTGQHFQGFSIGEKPGSCRACGRVAEDLHHAVPRSVCPPEAKRDLRNGLPLCKACHMKWHRKTLTIYRDVFTADEWAYISILELTGRDTAGWLEEHYPARTKAAFLAEYPKLVPFFNRVYALKVSADALTRSGGDS